MGDLKGMQYCVGVLAAQAVMMAMIFGLGVSSFWLPDHSSAQSMFLSKSIVFLAAFCCALFVFAIWKLLIQYTEEWWSIIAVQRVRIWLLNPLLPAMGLALATCVTYGFMAFKTNSTGASGTGGAIVPTILLVLAVLVPLAASSLLILAGLKRITVLRKNARLFLTSIESEEGGKLSRVRASINAENGIGETFARPEPKGFFFAGLTSKPWYESEELDWVADFEKNYKEVAAEARAVMTTLGNDIENYGYQGLNTDDWKKVSLVANRQENHVNLAACPTTAKLLKKIPGYPIFRDAMFSILEPNGEITPHRDYGNLFLTMHLGLKIPPEGFMEVANIRRNWQAGKALIFDSSYNHQAVNNSDQARVILLVDFLNPDLSEAERQWVLKAPFWKS